MFYSLLAIIAFVLGLLVGSFLNCVVYRLETKDSFLRGRSFCPKCKYVLAWYDLIPVLSFVWLKARCRHCKKKISIQYPLVELATGFLFLLAFVFAPWPDLGFLIYEWIIFSFLVLIFVYDLKHYIIPDRFLLPAISLVVFFRAAELFSNELLKRDLGISAVGLAWPWVAGLAASGFFFLIWLISRGKWMGFADCKLGFLLGLFLGWPNIIVALFFSFLIGSVIGLILISVKKKKLRSEVPFAPFLIIGCFIALFFGQGIINWYTGLIIF